MSDDKEVYQIEWVVPPWGAKPPTDPNHPISPPWPLRSSVQERQRSAAELCAEQAAHIDEKQLAQIAHLYDTHMANVKAQNDARAARQALDVPLPDDAELSMVAARAREIQDLDRYIAVLTPRCARSGQVLTDAISEVRGDLWIASEAVGGVVRRLRAERRHVAEQIAELEERAGDLELLIMDVASRLKAWNWPQDAPQAEPSPAEPPPVETVKPRKKRLFGGA